jgi:hypothetical protein
MMACSGGEISHLRGPSGGHAREIERRVEVVDGQVDVEGSSQVGRARGTCVFSSSPRAPFIWGGGVHPYPSTKVAKGGCQGEG